MTKIERFALARYWGMPLRIRAGNVELCKRGCWGILCSEPEGALNARIILSRCKEADRRRVLNGG